MIRRFKGNRSQEFECFSREGCFVFCNFEGLFLMPPIQASSCSGGAPAVRVCIFLLLLPVGFISWTLTRGSVVSIPLKDCPPCICDCPTSLPQQGSINSSTDCSKVDPVLRTEAGKNFVDLLTDELKLQTVVADDAKQKSTYALRDARKLSFEYRKEAEKCNLGMETCEEAREKAEENLAAEKKVSALWEERAKTLGWQDQEIRK